MNNSVTPSTSQSIHGLDDVWPSISLIQLSPVPLSPSWCDGSMAGGVAFRTSLPSALIVDTTSDRDSGKIKSTISVDECCQTKISWLGNSIKYITDDAVLSSKLAGASNKEIEPIIILDVDDVASSCVLNESTCVSDCVKVDACGRKIGVAGRMQSLPSFATDQSEATATLMDAEPLDDDSAEPSVVIQSDTGVGKLTPWKHSLNVPRDPRQRLCTDAHWSKNPLTGRIVHCKYASGSLVWAKFSSYPWWPAVVVSDPAYRMFYRCNENSKAISAYHVVFFDERRSRAWVPVERVKIYGGSHYLKLKQRTEKSSYNARLKKAVSAAEEVKLLTAKERSALYRVPQDSAQRSRSRLDNSIVHGATKISQLIEKPSPKITSSRTTSSVDQVKFRVARSTTSDDMFVSVFPHVAKDSKLNDTVCVVLDRLKDTSVRSQYGHRTGKSTVVRQRAESSVESYKNPMWTAKNSPGSCGTRRNSKTVDNSGSAKRSDSHPGPGEPPRTAASLTLTSAHWQHAVRLRRDKL